jgi:hypothetical protein
MLTCTSCGIEKANVHMYRLGETPEPICKTCQAYQQPNAEFEAMRIASGAIEKLQADARRRAMQYLTSRFGDQHA